MVIFRDMFKGYDYGYRLGVMVMLMVRILVMFNGYGYVDGFC